jgi:perosamine synthetase
MEGFPDLGPLSDDEVRALLKSMNEQEVETSYNRRILHGKIDLLRAELVNRLASSEGGSEPETSGRVVRDPAEEREEIPLARPFLGETEERSVVEVMRSGQLSLGPRVPQFERAFAARVRAAHASAVSSGTAGLHLALRAAGVSDGDEVVTTPFSFVASANVAMYERARPVFADIDPVTFNLDPAAAEAAITPGTRALLPVHIFGYPADLPAFEALAARHDLAIVEDACEALGAVHADRVPVGGRGHPTAFGFYANKQMTTGEGGMVTVGDAAVKQQIDSERNQGRTPDMDWLDHDRLGFNYRLSDIACAIGLVQLDRLDELLAARMDVASRYRDALGEVDGLGLPCEDADGNVRGWFVYVVQLPPEADRERVVAALRERGVQSKPYLPAIHLMAFYRERFGYREGQFPVCEDVAARSLALPFFPAMTEAQVERVARVLRTVLRR